MSRRNLDGLDEAILCEDRQAIFNEGFDDGLANVYDGLFDGFALRAASGQSGTENVLAAFGFLPADHSENDVPSRRIIESPAVSFTETSPAA